jgi:hypothetical protein
MKARYPALGLAQCLLICLSGWLERTARTEIDFSGGSEHWPLSLQVSFLFFSGWFGTIVLAAWFAVADKINRSMTLLFLVVLTPSLGFFAWILLSL